jgi:hypothetical protein
MFDHRAPLICFTQQRNGKNAQYALCLIFSADKGPVKVTVASPQPELSLTNSHWHDVAWLRHSTLGPHQTSILATARHRMISEKHYDSANDCHNHAPEVETGYALHAERAEQNSSDDRTHYAESDVEPEAFTGLVDNFAADEARNQTQYKPADNSHGFFSN